MAGMVSKISPIGQREAMTPDSLAPFSSCLHRVQAPQTIARSLNSDSPDRPNFHTTLYIDLSLHIRTFMQLAIGVGGLHRTRVTCDAHKFCLQAAQHHGLQNGTQRALALGFRSAAAISPTIALPEDWRCLVHRGAGPPSSLSWR